MISRFFFPDVLPREGEVTLPEQLAHHALRVLRLQPGAPIVLFDGRGGECAAHLVCRGRACSAVIESVEDVEREPPFELVLVQALASGDKMDWVVQKAVELGVAGLIPLEAERSVLRLSGDRATRRVAHWQQVVVSACEQSGRNRVPQVSPILPLPEYLATHRNVVKYVLSPEGGLPLSRMERPVGPLHLLIGPEGGWSDRELAACVAVGATSVALGPRILRTETAGLAALAAMQTLWGDF